ncbi:MAG: nucleotidyltransferase domain-containing protein [archaeon]
MRNKNVNSVLKEALEKIKPSAEELIEISPYVSKFIEEIKKEIGKNKVNAEVFLGGSFAKGTVVKKDVYDADIFLRFDKKEKDISQLTEKILRKILQPEKIHGSRDYFRIKKRGDFYIEVIPVLKIKNPREAENITDLSYSHVNYIKRKIKSKMLDEVLLAKAFCYANKCYGAESYIRGFSGYALELLILHYKSFLKFAKAVEKIHEDKKEVIDIEKHFRNRREILMDLNSAKLQSPIILVDPTYKQRNVLAALSKETFEEFKKSCREFLRNPSVKLFEHKEIDFDKEKLNARKKKLDFAVLKITTNKQEGDIAGSKLLKFYNHLGKEISKFFGIKKNGFEYKEGKNAMCFFSVKRKKEIILQGPMTKQEKNVEEFRKVHKNTFVKSGRIYAREKINFNLGEFLKKWKKRDARRMKEMSVKDINLVN